MFSEDTKQFIKSIWVPVLILWVCIVGINLTLKFQFANKRSDFTNSQLVGKYADYKQDTVLVFTSTKCKYCMASSDLFKELGNLPIQLIFVTKDDIDLVKSHLDKEHIRYNDVKKSVDPKINAIPAILIMDGNGTVTENFIGYVDKTERDSVLNTTRKGLKK